MASQEIHIPDIGEFENVPIVEVYVGPGDAVAVEDPLLMLETDKATMDVPSPVAGTIVSLAVAVGDTVSRGALIGTFDVTGAAAEEPAERLTSPPATAAAEPEPEPA